MREIILDTETTGLDPQDGHRIVEIGAIELLNRMPTGRVYHTYINPQRAMPEGAFRVHGLSDEFLRDKPLFADIAQDFLAFVMGGQLVIHNASFDMKFINAELCLLGHPSLGMNNVVDTLLMARQKFPGAKNSLDALCARFGIKTNHRKLHGALLDAELLLEVYLELHGGRQLGFSLDSNAATPNLGQQLPQPGTPSPQDIVTEKEDAVLGQSQRGEQNKKHNKAPSLGAWALSSLSEEEVALHTAMLTKISHPKWAKTTEVAGQK